MKAPKSLLTLLGAAAVALPTILSPQAQAQHQPSINDSSIEMTAGSPLDQQNTYEAALRFRTGRVIWEATATTQNDPSLEEETPQTYSSQTLEAYITIREWSNENIVEAPGMGFGIQHHKMQDQGSVTFRETAQYDVNQLRVYAAPGFRGGEGQWNFELASPMGIAIEHRDVQGDTYQENSTLAGGLLGLKMDFEYASDQGIAGLTGGFGFDIAGMPWMHPLASTGHGQIGMFVKPTEGIRLETGVKAQGMEVFYQDADNNYHHPSAGNTTLYFGTRVDL